MMTLEKAVLEMAYDNGCINVFQNEFDVLEKLKKYLEAEDDAYILEVEKWIGTLSAEDLDTFIAGEERDAREVAFDGPAHVDDFFNDIFENVL